MMFRKLIRPAINFAIAIACVLAFGGLFRLYTLEVLSEAKQDEVLIKAIPFVAVFVSIVLAFVYVIVAFAVLLSGKVPLRSYRPIEMLIVFGILFGVVNLFQGWRLFVYEYGFLLLLGSTLAFMIWSHLSPMTLRQSRVVPPLPQRAHLFGALFGVVVVVLLAGWLITDSKPQEPYGLNPQIWERMMDDEERAQTAEAADDEYIQNRIPYFILVSLLPGLALYFGVRELAVDESYKQQKLSALAQVDDAAAPVDAAELAR